MKVGDMIKFKGGWGKHQSCEILWDNGDYGVNHAVRGIEVINESR